MAVKFVLDTPEARDATVETSDVDTVRITGNIVCNFDLSQVTFWYEKGYYSGAQFVQTSLSSIVSITDPDAIAVVFNATVSDPTGSVRDNLEAALLQYLEDAKYIESGDVA